MKKDCYDLWLNTYNWISSIYLALCLLYGVSGILKIFSYTTKRNLLHKPFKWVDKSKHHGEYTRQNATSKIMLVSFGFFILPS